MTATTNIEIVHLEPEGAPDFYRVVAEADKAECCTCKQHAPLYTIEWTEPSGEPCTVGSSWGDEELANDICELMNMAYVAGQEAA